jgi:hypothetical protein
MANCQRVESIDEPDETLPAIDILLAMQRYDEVALRLQVKPEQHVRRLDLPPIVIEHLAHR